jgi:hypothetical protein
MDKITVYKGDSTDVKEFTIDGYTTLNSNWTGKKIVRVDLDTDTILDLDTTLDKSTDETMFLGYLNPTETNALDVGTYFLIFEIQNLNILPQFRREIHYKLSVKQHGSDNT